MQCVLLQEGDSEDEDEMKGYADDVDMPGQKFESKQRITVRNLRIREDTAKVKEHFEIELHCNLSLMINNSV